MILGASAYMQVLQALACFAVGLVCAFLWLLLDRVPMVKILRFVSDAFLVVLAAVAMLFVLQLMNKGELLIFHPLSLLFGFFISWTTVPKIIPKLKPSIEPKLFKSKGKLKRLILKGATALKNAALKVKAKADIIIGKLPKIKHTKKKILKNEHLLYERADV